jgi:hypothetical protein
MTLPSADTPLYSHPLPEIEQWLTSRGCQQDRQELHCWQIDRPTWKAELSLDIDQVTSMLEPTAKTFSEPSNTPSRVTTLKMPFSQAPNLILDWRF